MSEIAVIHPDAVYCLAELTRVLDLKPSSLPRELRLGRLRYSKRSEKVFILGRWVLEWLAQGEVKRRRSAASVNGEK
jgi:hypothetical protein